MPRSEKGGYDAPDSIAQPPVFVPPIASPLSPRDGGHQLGGRLFAEIQRRPARSLLVAVGTGYLAGGGLGTTFSARLLGSTARLALRLAIVPLFFDAFERALSRSPVNPGPPPSSHLPPSTIQHQ